MHRKTDRVCSQCPAPIDPRNKSGLCRTCSSRAMCARMSADPLAAEKRRKTIANWSPEVKARKVLHLFNREMSEAEREARREHGRHLVQNILSRPDVKVKIAASRERAGRKRSDTMLSWCPPEWRDLYRTLLQKHYTAAEAKETTLAAIEDDRQRSAKRAVADVDRRMREKHAAEVASRY